MEAATATSATTPASGAPASGSTATTATTTATTATDGGGKANDGATGGTSSTESTKARAANAGQNGTTDGGKTSTTTDTDIAPNTTTTTTPTTSAFDLAKWDGEVDSAPENARDILRAYDERRVAKKLKDIEAGYTPKFQKLADERRAFDEQKGGLDKKVADLTEEVRVYKTLLEGGEDPRLSEAVKRADTAEQQIAALSKERDDLKQKHEASERAQAESWLKTFKEEHKDVFVDEAKKKDLEGLIKHGWDPDAAVELVGATDEVKQAAEQIVRNGQIGPSGHRFAVQHAKAQLGASPAPRKPRVAATVTNGANGGAVNPTRVPGGPIRDMPIGDARREAARRGLAATRGAR